MKTFSTINKKEIKKISRNMGDIGGDWLKNFASRAIWQAVFVIHRNNGKFLRVYLYFNFWVVIKYIYCQI